MARQEDNNEKDFHKGTKVPYGGLTPDEVEQIIKTAAERASKAAIDSIGGKITDIVLNQIYRDIGKSVVRKALWTIGLGVLALLGWLGSKGMVKP